MKKIQVSTVRQLSDVEVIFINANLISKVIKADIAIDNVVVDAACSGAIKPQANVKLDEDGNKALDENGTPVMEPLLDENGMQIVYYDYLQLHPEQVKAIAEIVAPLLRELVDAFNA